MVARISFDREALRARIVDHFGAEIRELELRLEQSKSAEHYHQRVVEWRAGVESMFSAMFKRLGDVDNVELAAFEVPKLPKKPDWREQYATRTRVEEVRRRRDRALAAVDSLYGTAGGGSIELSAAQLRDFFGVSV